MHRLTETNINTHKTKTKYTSCMARWKTDQCHTNFENVLLTPSQYMYVYVCMYVAQVLTVWVCTFKVFLPLPTT